MGKKKNSRLSLTTKKQAWFSCNQRWYRVASVIFAAVAVFYTIYSFVPPAVAMEKAQNVSMSETNTDSANTDGTSADAATTSETNTDSTNQNTNDPTTSDTSADATNTDGTGADGTSSDATNTDETGADGTSSDGANADGTSTDETNTDGTGIGDTNTDNTNTGDTTTDGTSTDDAGTGETNTDATNTGDTTIDETTDNAEDQQPSEQNDTDSETVPADGEKTASENTRAASQGWGYNDDGSIWWSDITISSIASGEIQPDFAYVISGSGRASVMTNVETTGGDQDAHIKMLGTTQPGTDGNYLQYEYWYFELADAGYRIYTADSPETDKRYLKLTAIDSNKAEITLTTNSEEATVFTVGAATGAAGSTCVAINSDGYYLNSYGEDAGCRGWATWHEAGTPGGGSVLQILDVTQGVLSTAKPITTTDSPNTVINLFDYWISDNRTDRDDEEPNDANQLYNKNINEGHVLKFSRGNTSNFHSDNTNFEKLTGWVGEGKNPLQGIVQNNLNAEKYPVLSDTYNVEGYPTTESLDYLFNPDPELDEKIAGRKSFRNVKGLLHIDNEGYYNFSSQYSMAEFDEVTNSFTVYDKPGAGQNFFPFSNAPEIMAAANTDYHINHYMGMTITSRFMQQNNGYVDNKKDTPVEFNFSGDDDVWIFIDGVLIGDAGGIHDAATVNINFATGDVTVHVNNAVAGENPLTTTLYDCYVNAGKENSTAWTTLENGKKTYEDQTVHTLKFFYLERGNYESNLTLKYNLTEVPETAIHKIDQYGNPMPDAKFAVYAADTDYNMLSDLGGTQVTVPANPTYDEYGNMYDESGNFLAKSLYTGTTDGDGKLVFTDADDMPYTIKELEELFGKNFVLREVKVPVGYRIVSPEIHLKFWDGASQTVLECENTTTSGVRATTTMQVTAPDVLQLKKPYDGKNDVTYVDENGVTHGTLFAVVFKYIGKIENGKATEARDPTKWEPVWGSDEDGYTFVELLPENGDNANLIAAITAAQKMNTYYKREDFAFSSTPGGVMRLDMDNLPGRINQYYRMVGTDSIEDAQYTVSYYWTAAEDIVDADINNTRKVITKADASGDMAYSEMETLFASSIDVPNLENKVAVQKLDEDGNLINGATFAIYKVQQLDDDKGTLQAQATNGDWVTFPTEVVPDKETGAIKSEGKVILPLGTDITEDLADGIHKGTATFDNMEVGQYIIKEIEAPPGYTLNKSDVMLLVTQDTIYANAGTEEDGVTVGRGPGYLVAPLIAYGSEGHIDNTLTWMYARLLISPPSTLFSEATDSTLAWGYLTENNTGKRGEKKDATISYLKYDAGKVGTAFNYVENTERMAQSDAQNPTDTRRLFTTVGWNHYAILQDYNYGLQKCNQIGANYQNWSTNESGTELNLMNLFSRSTYIRVTDVQETTLRVKKVSAANENIVLSGAQFRLYKLDENGEKLYYTIETGTGESGTGETGTGTGETGTGTGDTGTGTGDTGTGTVETGTVEWTKDVNKALIVSTGADGMSDKNFLKLYDNTYYLEETKAPEGYAMLKEPIELTLEKTNLTTTAGEYVKVAGNLDSDTNLYTYTVTILNTVSFEMPETGGGGIKLYTTGGLFMMAVSLVYGYRKKNRRERRIK